MNRLWPGLAGMIVLLLNACADDRTGLERIKAGQRLRVAILTTAPFHFADQSLIRGLDHHIVSAYADSIHTRLQIIPAATLSEIKAYLKQGRAHIGIAGAMPPPADARITMSAAYGESEWVVVGRRGQRLPAGPEDIARGALVVAKDSPAAAVLQRLKDDNPLLRWSESGPASGPRLLQQISQNNLKLTLINADVYRYYRYLYPETKTAFSLARRWPSRWWLGRAKDDSLAASINTFIGQYRDSGKAQALRRVYFDHLDSFDYLDTVYYLRRIRQVLPRYAELFREAAIDHVFNERLLAAISYQESHWDAAARSPTGVRGMMMLTRETARRVGVNDRLDPKQSIQGGAGYLNILKQSLPERIAEPDRSWLALAAYNIGLGHLEDARRLAESLGGDPDRWTDVARHLPKLAEKEWHEKTRHGRARGREPVAFVRAVRRYYDILRLYRQEKRPARPAPARASPRFSRNGNAD